MAFISALTLLRSTCADDLLIILLLLALLLALILIIMLAIADLWIDAAAANDYILFIAIAAPLMDIDYDDLDDIEADIDIDADIAIDIDIAIEADADIDADIEA